jgi:hypothetical protein
VKVGDLVLAYVAGSSRLGLITSRTNRGIKYGRKIYVIALIDDLASEVFRDEVDLQLVSESAR